MKSLEELSKAEAAFIKNSIARAKEELLSNENLTPRQIKLGRKTSYETCYENCKESVNNED
tara:strand:- start:1201 stop:1383 length:183 start_codon:yes stop_codon:yes gene_type:complete